MANKTFRLSPSSLNLFKECPRCFWLTMHGVWKRPAGPFPSLPSGMDRILKKHFNNFRKKGTLPPELAEEDFCVGMKLFSDENKLRKWQNNFKGISFKDSEGNELHGAIDNLLVNGNKLVVIDYKTRGFPLKENSTDYYKLQLELYNFLLRKNNYQTEDFAFLLFYVPREVMATGEVIFDTTLRKIKIDVNHAERVWKDALSLLNGDCPTKTCEWCEKI